MATKAQHNIGYQILPSFLKEMRESAGLTQRQIGAKLKKPHSYIYNCETANRRVDITEFISWAKACDINPKTAFSKLLEHLK
ncbi:MAG: helix-turn-helix transcriptional regulator [Phycisphaerae bacterium]|nr:helix-turn-helix transcriptional regulator [Phycisphaerae bacterium]